MRSAILILGILFIGVLSFGCVGTSSNTRTSTTECASCPQSDPKAIVDVKIMTWGYNIYDENQLIFDYTVYNYGTVEAKNIGVKCKLFDERSMMVSSSSDNYGNLASQSVELGEFTPPKPATVDKNSKYSAVCYAESCDNCEILYQKVPELVKYYESVFSAPTQKY